MSHIEKEKLIKADIASIENRVRHAFNQGYDLGFKDGKEKAKPLEQETQTFKWCETCKEYDQEKHCCHRWSKVIRDTVEEMKQEPRWIPVSERLPETDNKNSINNYNVLLWVKDKNDSEDEPQIYLGKLKKVNGDDGSHNFWGIKTEPCEWTIWGWSYFHEPEVIAWQPLPAPYKAEIEPQESEDKE